MALPIIKIAVSNGHFQESLQNYGDRGTWTAELFSSPNTILTDANANWVENEWADYSCVVDTNGTNNVATIVSNTETTITVSGNQTGIDCLCNNRQHSNNDNNRNSDSSYSNNL